MLKTEAVTKIHNKRRLRNDPNKKHFIIMYELFSMTSAQS